jgi:hypothetical protein
MSDQTDEDSFDLLQNDEWDVEPGDDGDIRDPEAVLARMRASCWSPGPGWMKLTLTNKNADPDHSVFKGALTPVKTSAPPEIEQVARLGPPGFVV